MAKVKEFFKEIEEIQEMSLEEAKAFRASLYKPTVQELTEQDKREAFRIFWAQNRTKYGQTKEIEGILWLHLVATKLNSPENFINGIQNFGLKVN